MTTTNTTVNGMEVTIQGAISARSYRREQRYATKDGADGAAKLDLRIETEDFITFYVVWQANPGRGWGKRHRQGGFRTEAAARAFADSKWTICLHGWLASVVPMAGRPVDAVNL